MTRKHIGMAAVLALAAGAWAQPGNVLLVDAGASGANDGSSWANAFTGIQAAVDAALASSGAKDEVWVKAGTYRPTRAHTVTSGPDTVTVKTFDVNGSVKVFGGFAGTETTRAARDFVANVTTLTVATSGSEPVQLVRVGGFGVVDGFTLTGVTPASVGGNWFPVAAVLAGAGVVSHCTISGNVTSVGLPEPSYGAAVLLLSGYPTMASCTISGNTGRALLALTGSFDNGTISGNLSRAGEPTALFGPDDLVTLAGVSRVFGGTISSNGSTGVRYSKIVRADLLTRVARVSITGNRASNALVGGQYINDLVKDNICGVNAMANAALFNCTVMGNIGTGTTNCGGSNNILWGNGPAVGQRTYADQVGSSPAFAYTTIEFWNNNGGLGNNGDDPLLDANGVLQNGSPAIDGGSNALHPDGVFRDLNGNVRFFGTNVGAAGQGVPPVIDRGCFEFAAVGNGAWCYADFNGDSALNATDFVRFITLYNLGHPLANCDGSSVPPKNNAADLTCFVLKYQAGCP